VAIVYSADGRQFTCVLSNFHRGHRSVDIIYGALQGCCDMLFQMVITCDDIRHTPRAMHSMLPLILIVLSRLDRGIQSETEMLPLKRGRGVARSFNCTPRVCRICILLTHLYLCLCRSELVRGIMFPTWLFVFLSVCLLAFL